MGGKAVTLVCAFFPFLNKLKLDKNPTKTPKPQLHSFGADFFSLQTSLNPKQGEIKLSSRTAEDSEQINANSPILRSTELKQAHVFEI